MGGLSHADLDWQSLLHDPSVTNASFCSCISSLYIVLQFKLWLSLSKLSKPFVCLDNLPGLHKPLQTKKCGSLGFCPWTVPLKYDANNFSWNCGCCTIRCPGGYSTYCWFISSCCCLHQYSRHQTSIWLLFFATNHHLNTVRTLKGSVHFFDSLQWHSMFISAHLATFCLKHIC